MFTFLLILLILDSLVLIAAILLQSGKGSGLASSFGGVSSSADSLLGTRQAGNLLSRTGWWSGAVFLFLAYVLSLSSTRQRTPKSVLDQAFTQPAAPTAPATTPAGASAPAGVNLTPAAPNTAPAGTAPATPAPAKP
ncbi:MAG: preprotein translocase subunit SecG [Gemmatimonadaceae bacterium]